ncbi:hypothetical protein SynA1560_02163 [Synechococcus sp. A15-60]|nr:hypothetical protein SynA1560_02163 [Synechococcus sp. A15-60]
MRAKSKNGVEALNVVMNRWGALIDQGQGVLWMISSITTAVAGC